ncbi:structural cement protein Gp24 [Snodgrassella alvi]|jgi:hypothetical protein|uniref:structural cement protein Gp24 n=1 Tax=Snodgrassella alvi TaxID=1196083 RepID=UPI000C1E11B3|nr:hypothetical protein [Snodgrassella alvi]PIT21433.1 hypothetical protein BGI34_01090 [Snodgrassella alvi]
MSFQKTLNRDLPVGVEGDFASTNPYHTVLAGEGALKAGADGVTIGVFAWANATTGLVSNKQVQDGILGFVRRDNTALISQYLAESSMRIPAGFIITLYDKGDFWARFQGGAKIGQKVFASTADGTVTAADTAPADTVDTGFVVASNAAAGSLAKITK